MVVSGAFVYDISVSLVLLLSDYCFYSQYREQSCEICSSYCDHYLISVIFMVFFTFTIIIIILVPIVIIIVMTGIIVVIIINCIITIHIVGLAMLLFSTTLCLLLFSQYCHHVRVLVLVL